MDADNDLLAVWLGQELLHRRQSPSARHGAGLCLERVLQVSVLATFHPETVLTVCLRLLHQCRSTGRPEIAIIFLSIRPQRCEITPCYLEQKASNGAHIEKGARIRQSRLVGQRLGISDETIPPVGVAIRLLTQALDYHY